MYIFIYFEEMAQCQNLVSMCNFGKTVIPSFQKNCTSDTCTKLKCKSGRISVSNIAVLRLVSTPESQTMMVMIMYVDLHVENLMLMCYLG